MSTQPTINWSEVFAFVALCEVRKIEPPAAAVRGLELVAVADAYAEVPTGPLLGMTDAELQERIFAKSVRAHAPFHSMDGQGMEKGIRDVRNELAVEVREACIPDLDRIIAALQPEFKRAAEPFVVGAGKFGFTNETTSDEVILRADEKASAAWRAVREAYPKIAQIVKFRNLISSTFVLTPELRERSEDREILLGVKPANYSVNFAAGENWSIDEGYQTADGKSSIDWLALAKGGLHLNTASEVRAKLDGRFPPKPVVSWDEELGVMLSDPERQPNYTYPTNFPR